MPPTRLLSPQHTDPETLVHDSVLERRDGVEAALSCNGERTDRLPDEFLRVLLS